MLKLISWNVNGLRACYDKGFTDIFRQLDADFFCLQETKMQDNWICNSTVTSLIGTMPKRKDIREQLSLPDFNPSVSVTAWIEQNTTVRAVSLLSKWKISSWSMSILPTRKKD